MRQVRLAAVWPWRRDDRWVLVGYLWQWNWRDQVQRRVIVSGKPLDVLRTIAVMWHRDLRL